MKPCTDCGVLTPSITVMGKPAKNTTCVACTARNKADTRRIGKTCKVCKQRRQNVDAFYQLCPDCLNIEVPCPVCGEPMPKYRKRGMLRKFCSFRCSKIAHPTTGEQAKKANQTKWKNHIYKTHENRLARDTAEYKEWRKQVFERDNYTCQECGDHSGNGHAIVLHPHHIKPFATHKELRYDVNNGITLCQKCHRKVHEHVFIGRVSSRT